MEEGPHRPDQLQRLTCVDATAHALALIMVRGVLVVEARGEHVDGTLRGAVMSAVTISRPLGTLILMAGCLAHCACTEHAHPLAKHPEVNGDLE